MNIEWKAEEGNPKSLIVNIDGEFWRKVPKALFLRNLNKLRHSSNRKALESLFFPLEEKACFELALRLLSIRSHLSKELKQKLVLRSHSSHAIEAALAKCKHLQTLNDSHHLAALVRKEEKKGYGPHYIASKIKSLGYAPPEIEMNQEDAIRKLIAKKYRSVNLKDPKQKMKAMKSLQRRGFDLAAIRSVF